MKRVLIALTVGVSLTALTAAYADDVIWDFEEGNDHGFTLTSVNPATPAPDDPTTAGDEAITGVGGRPTSDPDFFPIVLHRERSMMKAVRIYDYGTAEVLCYEDAPTSEPGPREVCCQGRYEQQSVPAVNNAKTARDG